MGTRLRLITYLHGAVKDDFRFIKYEDTRTLPQLSPGFGCNGGILGHATKMQPTFSLQRHPSSVLPLKFVSQNHAIFLHT
jgi:hypothetical protein